MSGRRVTRPPEATACPDPMMTIGRSLSLFSEF